MQRGSFVEKKDKEHPLSLPALIKIRAESRDTKVDEGLCGILILPK
jgi:hypothetical protein